MEQFEENKKRIKEKYDKYANISASWEINFPPIKNNNIVQLYKLYKNS